MLYSSQMNKILWQHRIKSEDSRRGRGHREGNGSAEEVTPEQNLQG